uniref:TetR/AcrR family transcriptional regulator n=1 Tax=Phenylobacterium glaciei TaxID=2803784 RepID=A0A974P2H6_9CAUL|nr:TetR/AcrR family transcriptional regulator [Phenylobacterium glaciei]
MARAAGCDKQLIYRYFGGLEGLVDALGADFATWLEDSLGPATPPPPMASFRSAHPGVHGGAAGNVLVQRIAAWEIADPSPLVARLTVARAAP